MILPDKRQKLIRTESLAPLIRTLRSAMNSRIYDVPGIFIGKWLEQHVVDDAENRRAGANAERQSNDCHHRETGVAPDLTECMTQVLREAREEAVPTLPRCRFSRRLRSHLGWLLRQQILVIEFHQHITASVLVHRAAGNQLVVTIIQVLRDFLNHLDLVS